MNTQIKELVKKSGTDSSGKWMSIDNAEKFAELIVRECIDIAQDRANFPGFPPNDVNHIIDEIREHFGVEK